MSIPPVRRALLAAMVCSLSTAVSAESLGTIQVESSTIGDRFEDKRGEPSSQAVISGEQVDAAHSENIQDLLQGIPGITTELQSGDSLKIHIRGVENQVFMGEKPGVAVVIDGVPVFERTGRVNIDLDNIESIRVVKGGASYLFGDDALAGAVIITTKKGARHAGVRVAGEAGSFGYKKGVVRAGYAGDDSAAHVQVSRRETEGYYADSASRADYANGKLQYYLSDASDLQLGFELSNRKKNSHGAVSGVTAATLDPTSIDPAYNDYANHFDVDLQKYFLTYNRDLASGDSLTLNTYRFSDHTRYLSAPLANDPSSYTYGNDYQQVQRGIKGEYRSEGDALAWMLATDLRANRYDSEVLYQVAGALPYPPFTVYNPGDVFDDNSTDERVLAVYGEMKFRPADKWLVTLNGRSDRINLDYADNTATAFSNDSGTRDFAVSSWRLGGNYAASERLDFYGNLSTGFRAPSVSQLFVGTGSPTMRVDPNPDLVPERSLNMELGIRRSGTLFGLPTDLDAAIFQIDRADHVQASAGQYTTDAVNRYENVGDMRSRGLELTLKTTASARLAWDVAYTYLDAYYLTYDNFNLRTCAAVNPFSGLCTTYVTTPYDNAGNAIPRTPKHHLNLNVRYAPASHWLLTTEVDSTSAYFADEINQEEIGGHTVVNLLLAHEREMVGGNWEFFARVDNLFDRSYYNTVRGYTDGNLDGVYNAEDLSLVVNPGRRYNLGLAVNF